MLERFYLNQEKILEKSLNYFKTLVSNQIKVGVELEFFYLI